jgi:aminomethyltransferase
MADFGGYEMPLWYASAKEEHLCVLTHAGMFDTSHMALIGVTGDGARDLLQWYYTKDLERSVGSPPGPLTAGRCVYGAFCDGAGSVVDDAIVYQMAEGDYLVVVNAGMGAVVAAHLTAQVGERAVTVTDFTDQVGKIDLQGPAAAKIMVTLLDEPEAALQRLVYFSFKGHFNPAQASLRLKDGTPILLSRTGYTGEFGFELFMVPDRTASVWRQIIEAGDRLGLQVCGLAARDSLRGGAVLPLSHQDIGHWPFIDHPWEFALPFNDDKSGFSKPFLGDEALLANRGKAFTYPFVGNDLRKVSTADGATAHDADGARIGEVLTCVTDMAIGRVEGRIVSIASPEVPADFKPRGLCCGFVRVQRALETDEVITIKDKRRTLKVTIVDDVRPDRSARRPLKQML